MRKQNNSAKPNNKNGVNKGNRHTNTDKWYKDPKNKRGTIPENEDHSKASNNVADFSIDSNLLKNVASIPFSWAVGTPIDLDNKILSKTDSKGKFTIPGICRLVVNPSISRNVDASSPINIAANRIYAYVRHANSGSKNYDAPDLMLYLISIANVYGYILQLQRLLGTIGTYSVYNRYVPDTLISAMGGDPNSIRNNLANFRARLNMLITKAASFAVPANMPYFKNMAETLGNYYCEGTSFKDQMYLVYCHGFYRFNLNTDGSGMLQMVYPSGSTVDDLMNFGESLLDPLTYSEDMNIMSGDILKAYGSDGIYKLATIPEDYAIMPLMDIPVLEQIKNAVTVGMLWDNKTVANIGDNIYQDPTHAYLKCDNVLTTFKRDGENDTVANAIALSLQTLDERRIMTTTTKDVSPELVMENSKFMVAVDGYTHDAGSAVASVNLHTRNFTPLRFEIYHGDVQGDGTVKIASHAFTYATPIDFSDNDMLKMWVHKNAISRHFKFSPIVHALGYKPGSASPAVSFAESEIYQDVDNYAIIEDQTLQAMHEAAMLSLLHVVSVGQA